MTAPRATEGDHRAYLFRCATEDVKHLGFISTQISLELERIGVNVAALERELIDTHVTP